MNSLTRSMTLIVAGALTLAAVPTLSLAAKPKAPDTRTVRRPESRKKLGENHKGRLTGDNSKMKNTGAKPFSEKSFSNKEVQRQRSESLRARHEAAFGKPQTNTVTRASNATTTKVKEQK